MTTLRVWSLRTSALPLADRHRRSEDEEQVPELRVVDRQAVSA